MTDTTKFTWVLDAYAREVIAGAKAEEFGVQATEEEWAAVVEKAKAAATKEAADDAAFFARVRAEKEACAERAAFAAAVEEIFFARHGVPWPMVGHSGEKRATLVVGGGWASDDAPRTLCEVANHWRLTHPEGTPEEFVAAAVIVPLTWHQGPNGGFARGGTVSWPGV